ncbi:hypothetical protein BB561_005593 [Smittium simulii]|uniref:UBX domain-containing protein n=1 Tax=Smittium simulii TaxID=133385 RepID=A0A2T9Y9P0_9FUNG|nr:hypothetical protein BB561_005593 [Smittium simulii]
MSKLSLKWFEHSASEAVFTALSLKKCFLAFIYDDSPQSTTILELLQDTPLLSELCVNYKVEAKTVEAQQLSQIYDMPELSTDSKKNLDSSESIEKTPVILSQNDPSITNINSSLESQQSSSSNGLSLVHHNAVDGTEENTNLSKVIDNYSKVDTSQNETLENDINYFKKLSSDMLKSKNQDLLLKKKILQHIKDNRKAKNQRTEFRPNCIDSSSKLNNKLDHTINHKVKIDYSKANISIKLVDGSVIKNSFASTITFAEFVTLIELEVGSLKNLQFFQLFPFKAFDESNYNQSLSQLGFSPSISLALKFKSNKYSLLNSIFKTAALYIFSFIKAICFNIYYFYLGTTPPINRKPPQPIKPQASAAAEVSIDSKKNYNSSSSLRKRILTTNKKKNFKLSDDDDDQIYYNGNTTNIE